MIGEDVSEVVLMTEDGETQHFPMQSDGTQSPSTPHFDGTEIADQWLAEVSIQKCFFSVLLSGVLQHKSKVFVL